MGAMENKGLNIFNSKFVLARPDTATDRDFQGIEGVIAHEYFHNWTGNRITCRDWFQLCLKEGLTVFRDAEFTADLRSAAVKRISDVIELRQTAVGLNQARIELYAQILEARTDLQGPARRQGHGGDVVDRPFGLDRHGERPLAGHRPTAGPW